MTKTKPNNATFSLDLPSTSWLLIFAYLVFSGFCLWQFLLPYFAERHYRDGYNFSALKRTKYAIEEFEAAVDCAPWETQYMVELGRAYEDYSEEQQTLPEKLRYLDKAEALYKHMIELDRLNPWFQNRLAIIYARESELIPEKQSSFLQMAHDRTKLAAELDNQNPLFQLNYASFLHRMGRIDEAIPYYEKTLRYDPNMSEALYNLADIYRRKNRMDLTLKLYEELYEKNPDFQNLSLALASTYLQLGRRQDALNQLELSVSRNPQQLEPLKTLGSLYYEQKDWVKAADIYDKIVVFFPDQHPIHQFKVQALVAAGKPIDAYQSLESYLQTYPDDAVAKSQFASLKQILRR